MAIEIFSETYGEATRIVIARINAGYSVKVHASDLITTPWKTHREPATFTVTHTCTATRHDGKEYTAPCKDVYDFIDNLKAYNCGKLTAKDVETL